MRLLFTDKWNSFWHLFFGMLAVRYQIIVPAFILYQLIDWHDKNMMCDLSEFFIGFGLYTLIQIFIFREVEFKNSE